MTLAKCVPFHSGLNTLRAETYRYSKIFKQWQHMYVSTKINNTIPTVVFKELSQHKPIHIKYQKYFNASITNGTTLLLTRRKLLAKINKVTECTIDEHEQTCVKGSNFQRHTHNSCDILCVNHKSWNQLCQVYMGLNGCIQTGMCLDWLNFTMSGHLDDFIWRNFVVCLSTVYCENISYNTYRGYPAKRALSAMRQHGG